MAETRKYFRKAIAPPPKPPKAPRVRHTGKILLGTRVDAGKPTRQFILDREAASQQGRSKGGRTTADRGTGYKFTTETARKAAKKAWATRWRMNKRINTRLGRPVRNAPRVDREPLRRLYGNMPSKNVVYLPDTCKWWVVDNLENPIREISERAALIRLGHLPPKSGRRAQFIPETLVGVPRPSTEIA